MVAVAEGGVIGKANQVPWHSSADLKRFKQITMGSTVLMGRKTFESLGRRPLLGRKNFLLSRRTKEIPSVGNVKIFDSIEEALANVDTEKVFIIGGEEIFRQTLDRVDGIWLTPVEGSYEGDAHYPEIPLERFELKSREKCTEDPRLEFLYYERK